MDWLGKDQYTSNKCFKDLVVACQHAIEDNLPEGSDIKLISTNTKRLTSEAFAVMLNMLTGKKIDMLFDGSKGSKISFNGNKIIKFEVKEDEGKNKDIVIQRSKQVRIPNEQLKEIFNKEPKEIKKDIFIKWQKLSGKGV